MKTIFAGFVATTLLIASALSAQAMNADSTARANNQLHMPVYGKSLPPIGYIGFCRTHPQECTTGTFKPVRVVMSNQRWQEMTLINSHINKIVKPVTDQELYNVPERWTYPTAQGDCEDYVLLKRRYLINMGWPEQSLLITVVRDQKNEGHAVLTVTTDLGDFILDNQSQNVLPWQDTPYRYEMRQSQSNKNGWVILNPAAMAKQATVTSRTNITIEKTVR